MSPTDEPDNVLFRLYEQYIGEPETDTDVYLGFGLFFVAIGFGLLSLALFVSAVALDGFRGDQYFAIAGPAYVLGMLSLPLLMLGIVVLLPIKRRATGAAAVGVLVVGVAAGLFWTAYPSEWAEFGDAQVLQVIGIYAAGMIVVLSSTGAALVAHQLQRVQAPTPSQVAEREIDDEASETESYSDEEIERDIEQAMADVDLTWGGVESTEHRQLTIKTDFADETIEAGGVNVEANTRVESGGVDEQVQGLRNMKGGETKTATSASTVDDQTAALNELKKQKEADQVPDNAPTANRGFLGRVLDRVGLT